MYQKPTEAEIQKIIAQVKAVQAEKAALEHEACMAAEEKAKYPKKFQETWTVEVAAQENDPFDSTLEATEEKSWFEGGTFTAGQFSMPVMWTPPQKGTMSIGNTPYGAMNMTPKEYLMNTKCMFKELPGGKEVIIVDDGFGYFVIPVLAQFSAGNDDIFGDNSKYFFGSIWDKMMSQIFNQAAKVFMPKVNKVKK